MLKRKLSKKEQYQQLLKARNQLTISIILLPIILIVLYEFLENWLENEKLVIIIIIILLVLGFLFTIFHFLAYDLCPWCKHQFFMSSRKLGNSRGIDIFFRKKCCNCKEPKNPDSFLD
ncbi:hypothetical protein QSV37_13250 [Acinetobacter sp. VNK23]|uniref:hypothetical protein n=1 Tax=Acinetobacter thutiue TaxID=2998078 RepID=UPI002575467C|nr:hypothetical protein [Acinetobacter thutiue]MDM1021261.1 hypothetical protein [Acinetobacter thutiue]